MATHSNILVWRVPWTETLGGKQPMEGQRVRHNWATNTHTHVYTYTICFCKIYPAITLECLEQICITFLKPFRAILELIICHTERFLLLLRHFFFSWYLLLYKWLFCFMPVFMVFDCVSKLGIQERHPNHNTKINIKKELLGAFQVALYIYIYIFFFHSPQTCCR